MNDIQVPKEGSTRVEVHMLTFEMYPQANNVLEMACLVNCNPKIWFAPALLINYIFKIVAAGHAGRRKVLGQNPQVLRNRP